MAGAGAAGGGDESGGAGGNACAAFFLMGRRVAAAYAAGRHRCAARCPQTMQRAGGAAILRAAFAYFFLVFMVRIVGRRPGKQMNPFEFVLIFFIGGLALTFTVADDASLTNAFTQIITIALAHLLLVLLRQRSSRFAGCGTGRRRC